MKQMDGNGNNLQSTIWPLWTVYTLTERRSHMVCVSEVAPSAHKKQKMASGFDAEKPHSEHFVLTGLDK